MKICFLTNHLIIHYIQFTKKLFKPPLQKDSKTKSNFTTQMLPNYDSRNFKFTPAKA